MTRFTEGRLRDEPPARTTPGASRDLLARCQAAVTEGLAPAPYVTVEQAVIVAAVAAQYVEISVIYDVAHGVWVAYPVGGPWTDAEDRLPIVSGSDPVAVLDELLARPAHNQEG